MITKKEAKKFMKELTAKVGSKFTLDDASRMMRLSKANTRIWLSACMHFGLMRGVV